MFVCLLAVVAMFPTDTFAERYVLTDTISNQQSSTFEISDSQSGVDWSVRKKILRGGKQEGVELVTIDNGVLTIVVIPTRGMSVLEVVHKNGIRLGWDSPVKEVVHPHYINLHSRGGLGWLDGFNEWMVRCGLESAGHPGKDEFINNTGDKVEMDLTLHGKIGNIPASLVEVIVDQESPYRIRLRGAVNERMFYGPKLELTTEISTIPGSSSFTIEDKLANYGATDQEFQLIYHANYGPPILEKGSEVVVAAKSVSPMNDHAGKSVNEYNVYDAPTKGFVEKVYLFEPIADKSGRSTALLKNKTGNKGTTVRWSTSQLPYLTVWKNTAAMESGYVTGIEPATGFPYKRGVERKFGRVPKLGPGETRSFALEFEVLADVRSVKKAEKAIRQLQANVLPKISTKPLVTQ